MWSSSSNQNGATELRVSPSQKTLIDGGGLQVPLWIVPIPFLGGVWLFVASRAVSGGIQVLGCPHNGPTGPHISSCALRHVQKPLPQPSHQAPHTGLYLPLAGVIPADCQ